MKNRIKYIYSALLCILVVAVFAACSDNLNHSQATSDSCEMELRLLSDPATRSVADDEGKINTVDVLVFDGKNVDYDNATFAYKRTAWSTDGGNTYRVVLLKADTVDIYFAINATNAVTAAAPAQGNLWSDVRKTLLLTQPDKIDDGLSSPGLPMWGQKLSVPVKAASTYGDLGIIKLLRSVSSAEVEMKDNNFSLFAGYIVNGADKGYLPYDVTKIVNDSVIAPYVPSGMTPTVGNNAEWADTLQVGENTITGAFYMLENGDAVNNTKIILEGRWGGSTKPAGVNTFYPLAFHNPNNALLKKDVTRNLKFIINITKVNADGYDSFEDAKNGEEVNMDYQIIRWGVNDPAEAFIDGPNSIYVDPRRSHVTLGRAIGATAELRFVTDFDLDGIQMKLPTTTGNGENILLDTHTRFKIERLVRKNATGQDYNCFLITTKKVFEAAATDNPATFIIDVDGRLSFEINAEQIDGSNDDWKQGYAVKDSLERIVVGR